MRAPSTSTIREVQESLRILPREEHLAHLLSVLSRRFSAEENLLWTGTVAGPLYTGTYARCQDPRCPAKSPQCFEKGAAGGPSSECVHRFPHTFVGLVSSAGRVKVGRSAMGWDSIEVSPGGPLFLRIEVADPETTPDYSGKLRAYLENRFAPTLDDEDEEGGEDEGREPLERFQESSYALLECTFQCLPTEACVANRGSP